MIKKALGWLEKLFDDKVDPEEPVYDAAHIGIMIVFVLLALTLLFWLLWALLVFGGGLQAKLVPFLKVLLTSRTAADYGYVGYPYEMGVFTGWPTNVIALALTLFVITCIWIVFKRNNK
jgi:hypothetical protein